MTIWMKCGCWLLVAVIGMGSALSGLGETTVFRHGQVLLPVLVARDAAPAERLAAEELGQVLEKMSGLSWPVRAPVRAGERGFYLGRSFARAGESLKVARDPLAPVADEMSPDGFRVESHDGSIFIEGATPKAASFAVSWLLQREGGVRWYVPGASGEVVPRRTEWSLPDLQVRHEPAYVSREITGLETLEERKWAARNGLRGRFEFSHALARVFPLSSLSEHPAWRPLIDGTRYLPTTATDADWQPDLSVPEVAAHAAQQAQAAFSADSARLSFSLGINDTVRFDRSEETQAMVAPLRYFRGRPDYSPLVFTFMNWVAELTARSNPERYLGCLAYFWCENPPLFPVHRNVLPYVTTDRSQYYDHAYRSVDFAIMARWGASGTAAFGLWEYAYGRGFLVPRLPLTSLAEAVKEGWHRGARGYLAEVGPHWGFDSFKVWLLAQLLWEPERSVAELADDFYRGYYGKAAQPMRQFFERSEQQWMQQPGPPGWLKFYQQEDQAELFPVEVCEELRALLADAARLAGRDRSVVARVDRTSRAFAVTEAWVKFDSIRRMLARGRAESVDGSELAVSDLIRSMVEAETILRESVKIATEGELPAMTDVDLSALVRNDPVPRLLWLAGLRDPMAPRRILEAAGARAMARGSWCLLSDFVADRRMRAAPNLAVNSGFAKNALQPMEPRFLYPRFGILPANWTLRAMPTENGKVELVERQLPMARRALRIEGAWDTQLFQWIPVEDDCSYVAMARLRGQSSAGNDSALFLTFVNPAGEVVGAVRMQSIPKGLTADWRLSVLCGRAPEGAAWVGVGIGSSRQNSGDWLEATSVELHGVVKPNKQ